MTKAYVFTADDNKPPLPSHLADQIWGINVCRSLADLDGAPEPMVRGFMMFTTENTFTRCCGCGDENMGKAGGLAVLRTHMPGQKFIGMGICKGCLSDPDSKRITKRIFKTLTGKNKPFVNWKDTLS